MFSSPQYLLANRQHQVWQQLHFHRSWPKGASASPLCCDVYWQCILFLDCTASAFRTLRNGSVVSLKPGPPQKADSTTCCSGSREEGLEQQSEKKDAHCNERHDLTFWIKLLLIRLHTSSSCAVSVTSMPNSCCRPVMSKPLSNSNCNSSKHCSGCCCSSSSHIHQAPAAVARQWQCSLHQLATSAWGSSWQLLAVAGSWASGRSSRVSSCTGPLATTGPSRSFCQQGEWAAPQWTIVTSFCFFKIWLSGKQATEPIASHSSLVTRQTVPCVLQ